MSKPYIHNGWLVSPYSAKTRTYLRYKRIPFEDRVPSGVRLMWQIRRAVGAAIMPTVQTPEGGWLQDSSDIIDEFERRFPERSITPPGPTQRVASLLLELHGDEWLPLAALHYRWNLPENHRFAISEFARCGFPFLPGALARRAARPMADKMRGYLPVLGVTKETQPGVERYTTGLIAQLNAHLESHDYLLGGRPCMGDFALFGPLWAHLFRDPASTCLFDEAPAVRAWFDRLLEPPETTGAFLPDDEVPASLDPVFETLFAEQFVYVRALVGHIDRYCEANPDAHRVPRALGKEQFVMGGVAGTRKLITFSQWKAQRPRDAYERCDAEEKGRVDAWLERVGGLGFREQAIAHPFTRREFKTVLKVPAGASS